MTVGLSLPGCYPVAGEDMVPLLKRPHFSRPHVSPSMAVSLVVLVLAASGGAYAAGAASSSSQFSACVDHLGGGLYVQGRCARHDRRVTWNIAGARGAVGPAGPSGPQGPQGLQGPAGPSAGPPGGNLAGGVLTGRVNGLSTLPNALDFFAPSGITLTPLANQGLASTLSPDAALVARDLSVQLSTAPGASSNEARTLSLDVNGSPSALSCTVAGTATTCTSPGPVSVPAGSQLAFTDATGLTAVTASDARFAFRLSPS